MTSKERAELRGQANTLEPLFQVGKGGVSDAVIAQTLEAFNTRELIKLKVLLETAPETPREIAEKIAVGTGSEVVQVIGGSMIFYKENPELREGKKPAKKPAKKGKPLSRVKAKRAAAMKAEAAKKAEAQKRRYTSRKPK